MDLPSPAIDPPAAVVSGTAVLIASMRCSIRANDSWASRYELTALLGLHDRHAVVDGVLGIEVNALNGIVWGAIYGALGAVIDRTRIVLRS